MTAIAFMIAALHSLPSILAYGKGRAERSCLKINLSQRKSTSTQVLQDKGVKSHFYLSMGEVKRFCGIAAF